MQSLKVGVIGVGNIGAAYAFALSQSRLVKKLVLIDLDFELALAHAADLTSAQRGCSAPIHIYAGHWKALANADLIVLAAGVRKRDGMDLDRIASRNFTIFKEIFTELPLENFSGVLLVASGPVDLLTTVALRFSGLPRTQVIGVGTVATSHHLSLLLSQELGVAPEILHSFAVGAHRMSEFVLWSQVSVGGLPLADVIEKRGVSHQRLIDLFDKIQNNSLKILKGKGSICYATVSALMQISRAVLCDNDSLLTVTTPLESEYGCSGVSLAVPGLVGSKGVEILQFECTTKEREGFCNAASSVAESFARIEVDF